MVLSFLQQRAAADEPVQHPGLGSLFVEFLQRYGVLIVLGLRVRLGGRVRIGSGGDGQVAECEM